MDGETSLCLAAIGEEPGGTPRFPATLTWYWICKSIRMCCDQSVFDVSSPNTMSTLQKEKTKRFTKELFLLK